MTNNIGTKEMPITCDEALALARHYAPHRTARTARVVFDGIACYDVDLDKNYAYPAGHLGEVDFFVNGGYSSPHNDQHAMRVFAVIVAVISIVTACLVIFATKGVV